jgi:putative addiction module killer protein
MLFEVFETDYFSKWKRGLRDVKARAKIAFCIRKMELGNFGDVKPVGEGISEARIHYGPGYRLYFIQNGKQIIVLLCGGDKSTQSKDINTAKELKKCLK